MTKKSLSDLLREEVQQTIPETKITSAPSQLQELNQALTEERHKNKTLEQQIQALITSAQEHSQKVTQLEAQLNQTQQENALLKRDLEGFAAVTQQLSATQLQVIQLEKTMESLEQQLGDRQEVLAPVNLVAYQTPTGPYVAAPHQPSSHLSNEEIGWFD